MKAFNLLFVVLLLAGCQTPGLEKTGLTSSGFQVEDVAKGDIDQVAEVTLHQSRAYLQLLADKLYRRNPDQLKIGGYSAGREQVVSWLMGEPPSALKAQWQGKRAAELINLGFDEHYPGDRVATLVYGLRTMLTDAYGGEQAFYLGHQYDPQKIYHLARNIEIAAWRLKSVRDVSGRPVLLSVGRDDRGVLNTSFERLVGKLVALHDHFAQVVADTGGRRIKNVIQSVASAVFFPI